MTEEFSHHEPCPNCGSMDNLGVWTDGHKWCFGCQFRVPGEGELLSNEAIKARLMKKTINTSENKNDSSDSPNLPADFTPALSTIGAQWLLKYGISKGERIKNHIGWSERYQSLVFPVYDPHDNLLIVQRRYCGTEKWPKYHTKGHPEHVLHILGDRNSDTGIVVEDLVSAIKVGRQFDAVPLWGSNLSAEKINQLAFRFKRLVLWLDRDKASTAVKFKWKASPYFDHISIIVSDKDPKEYNDEAIYDFVAKCF